MFSGRLFDISHFVFLFRCFYRFLIGRISREAVKQKNSLAMNVTVNLPSVNGYVRSVSFQLSFMSPQFHFTSVNGYVRSVSFHLSQCNALLHYNAQCISCNGERELGIFHFKDHFKLKCHFHFLIHGVLVKSP